MINLIDFIDANELSYLLGLMLALVLGIIIGVEREWKKKPAGIRTQSLVIAAAMTFTFISNNVNAPDPTRIAAQIVSGVGFLGAGIIFRSQITNSVTNLTTAASIWYAAAIGIAIGYEFYFVAIFATIFAIVVTLIPKVNKSSTDESEDID
jgi:putative Mg2+ transporter-C (MgtC) family protein